MRSEPVHHQGVVASIEDNYSIDYLAHSAFAASVRPDQRHDFTRVDIQISIREGYNTTVVLDNISGGKRLSHVY